MEPRRVNRFGKFRQLGALALAAVGPVFAGCPSDPVKSTCQVETQEVTVAHQTVPPAMSLMLLPDARLDVVGDAFVLLGTDGSNVRWAVLGKDGVVVGDEQSIAVPPHSAGPWFAVAGTSAPRDHVVVAFVPADAATVGSVELMTLSVQIDGTSPTLPVSSGQIPAGARVTMMSGRGGMNAGIAWARQGQTDILARIVGGSGLPAGQDLMLGSVAGNFECLRFSPGKADLTLGYVDLSGTPSAIAFVGVEVDANGTARSPFRLSIGKEVPGCVELVSTDKGYGLAWHNDIGTYFSVFDPASMQLASVLVASNVRFPVEPRLGGLGWLGKTYAVVFARDQGAETWPIDANGHTQGVLPVFPSKVGHTGSLSTQPIGSALYATYADYADSTATSAGTRLLVKVSCP